VTELIVKIFALCQSGGCTGTFDRETAERRHRDRPAFNEAKQPRGRPLEKIGVRALCNLVNGLLAPGKFVSVLLVCGCFLFSRCPAFAAEIPFDNPGEFPASAYRLVADKRVIWLGEMHGTREAPELLLGLVRLVSTHDKVPPVVALEIPATQQHAIDRYLTSGDEAFLRSTGFFGSDTKDGRSSVALVRLLSQLRTEKKTAVLCFDPAEAKTAQERDTGMAQNLRLCAKKFPEAKLVVLSGNFHSRVVPGASFDPTYRPAADELNKQLGSVVSFTLEFESGTIWARTEKGFGKYQVKGQRWPGTASHYITLYPQRTRGYDGAIFTRAVTASPPW
jgi:erythromycin esterase-like protein